MRQHSLRPLPSVADTPRSTKANNVQASKAGGKAPALQPLPSGVQPRKVNLRPLPSQTNEEEGGGGRGGGWSLDAAADERLRQVFQAMDGNGDEGREGRERVDVRQLLTGLLMEFGMGAGALEGVGAASFEAFRAHFVRELEVTRKQQALAGEEIARAVAECVQGGCAEEPLSELAGMSDEGVSAWCKRVVAGALVPVLVRQRRELVARRERMREGEGGKKGNQKFCVATFGDVREFHRGISGQLGLPHPRVWEGMEAEHCRRKGSGSEFSPGNYDNVTTPAREWRVATDAEEGRRVCEGDANGRRVIATEELMCLEIVKKAGLRVEEAVALKLYTGPMFCLYNAALRGFPADKVLLLEGNTYATTIHCIVSGIIKLSRVMELPGDRTVYRGLGGLSLPDAFVKMDEYGVRGGVEFAMMSTTLDRKVAVQYAGGSVPTIFEIGVGAIDRGASLSFLSQYPKEEEILLPPRSYLEVVGTTREEVEEDGKRVLVVTLKVNANVTSSTLEQIEGKRRELLLSAGEHALHEIESKLRARFEEEGVKQMLAQRSGARMYKDHELLCFMILRDVKEWLAKHKAREAEWYNDDFQYAGAMRELMQLEGMAMDKVHRFIEHCDHFNTRLFEVSRVVESDMMARLEGIVAKCGAETWAWGRLPSVVSWGPMGLGVKAGRRVGAEQEAVALELCKRRGCVIKSLEEENASGESPIVAAGVTGDVKNIKLLLAAGGWVGSVSSSDATTAMHWACKMGHVDAVRVLAAAGGRDLLVMKHRFGQTCAHFAAENGHADVLRLLIEAGGRGLVMMADNRGKSCAHLASERGQAGSLRVLIEASPELMVLEAKDGRTCAALASQHGHVEALRVLIEAGGKDLLALEDKYGWSSAHHAAQNGHIEALRVLIEAGGGELVTMVAKDGQCCAHLAAANGRVDALRLLIEAGGRGVVMMLGSCGRSCAHLAAAKGHTEALRLLIEVGGRDLVMILDEEGWSCAHFAAEYGHVDALRVLIEAGGSALVMIAVKGGTSCAHLACEFGHIEALRLLIESGGRDLVMMVDSKGRSCAHIASAHTREDIVQVLTDAGGRELVMMLNGDGQSCAHIASALGFVEVLRVLVEAGGKGLVVLEDRYGWTSAHLLSVYGHLKALRMLVQQFGRDLLTARDKRGLSVLAVGVKHSGVCQYVAGEGGFEVVGMADGRGWTPFHHLVYCGKEVIAREVARGCGDEGEALLQRSEREVANGRDDGALRVVRGWPSTVRVDAEESGVRVGFCGDFCTVRSQELCQKGSRAYYELEIVSRDACPQFGFAKDGFSQVRGASENGVGDDSESWAVDGTRRMKWQGGTPEKLDCAWRVGDVIGLACDLVEGKMHVSHNGSFAKPNGAVFDIDAGEGRGLCAAFTGKTGEVRCNLGGGGGFRHSPPPVEDDGVAYVAFGQLGSDQA